MKYGIEKSATETKVRIGAAFFVASLALLASADVRAESRTCPPGRPCVVTPTPGARPAPVPGTRPSPSPVVGPGPGPQCPPGTVLDSALRRCVVGSPTRPTPVSRGPMRPVPAASTSNLDEFSAANIVNESLRGLDCSQAAQALRRLSNQVLSMSISAREPDPSGRPIPEFKRAARDRIRSQAFWTKVWNRMADAYRACDRTCFDDGLAVGEISATSYCSASIAVDGLPGIGFLPQSPLPVCETAIYAGCIQSYQKTASSYDGCRKYTSDSFAGIFADYQSQDCHL